MRDTGCSRLRRVGEPEDVIIDGIFREFVGYLAIDDEYSAVSGPLPVATVFFVHFTDNNGGAVYGVTARHCLDGLEFVYVQMRGKPDYKSRVSDWVEHPKTDIAVCRIEGVLPSNSYTLSADRLPQGHAISFGKQIFTIGLFTPLPGNRAVESIVRSGMIALPMTDQARICLTPSTDSNNYTQVRGRLIETRSIGGQSGSPVFVYSEHHLSPRDLTWNDMGAGKVHKSEVSASETDCSLLGIFHGHYRVDTPATDGRTLDMNAGIALVIPVEELWSFLMTDKRLIEDRKQTPKRPTSIPVPDVAQQQGNSFTKEDFEDALKRASRRIQSLPPDEEKSKT